MEVGDFDARKLEEVVDRLDADNLLSVIADPERDRGAPVAVAGDGPVAGIAEPVAKAVVLDKLGDPVAERIVGQELVDEAFDANKPRRDGLVDQGRI